MLMETPRSFLTRSITELKDCRLVQPMSRNIARSQGDRWSIGAMAWFRKSSEYNEAGDGPMKRKMSKDIDEYLEHHSSEDQRLLRQMRATIHKAAPEAAEKISYGIPTFYLNGNLVHFAA